MPDRDTQLLMDFRLPAGVEHVTPKELGAASGFSGQHIIDNFDTGKAFGFASNGRAKKGKEVRKTIRIPRENAVLWLCIHANYTADLILENITAIVAKLPRQLRVELIRRISKTL